MVGIAPDELVVLPLVSKRVQAVREMRLASSKEVENPWLFDEVRPPKGAYIGIPKVSSSDRNYVSFGFVTNGMIPGDKLYFVETDQLYHFGILISQFRNAWMRTVAGRLGDGYRYSNTIVYNNFVWPEATLEQKKAIERTAQGILNARSNYPNKSLAELHDPDRMSADLLLRIKLMMLRLKLLTSSILVVMKR